MSDQADAMGHRWIFQTEFADPTSGKIGNCMQAALASLLGISLEEVPHIYEANAGNPSVELGRFLHERGYYLIALSNSDFRPQGLYLGGGPAARGVDHVVVMHGDKIVHDPHPSNAGLVKLTDVLLIVPVDPAMKGYRGVAT